jgi:uncharacterized protein (TIGR03435 family)
VKRLPAIAVALAAGLAAQTGDGGAQPAFEAASVKPAPAGGQFAIRLDPGRLTASHVQLIFLIRDAYSVQEFRISGAPAWAAKDFWNVAAKSSGTFGVEQRKAMVRTLLAERFQLQTHWENRKMPVYVLAVDKNGPKLRAPKPDEEMDIWVEPKPQGARLVGRRATMGQLAEMLSEWMRRTVVDKTGLSGEYDFRTDWTPDARDPMGLEMMIGTRLARAEEGSADPEDAPGPSLAAALRERLGLKLESAKAPVRILVIDRVEKPSGD